MKLLQIHDARPLSDFERICIERAKSMIDIRKDSYEFIQIPYFDNIVDTINYSDRLRFDWLARNPDGVYLDTDCFLQYPLANFVATTDKPCFALAPEGHVDIFFIIVNGNTEFIEKTFAKELREQYLKEVEPSLQSQYYSWPVELMPPVDSINQIPNIGYVHARSTMNPEIIRRTSRK